MRWDAQDIEGAAVEAYRRAGLDPAEPAPTPRVARLLFGPGVIQRPRLRLVGLGASCFLDGVPKIMVRPNLPEEVVNFVVGHELAHILVGDMSNDPENEARCNYLGGALMAPAPAARALFRWASLNIKQIADAACGTQTWAALRIGEATGMPTAAVSPAFVRVRGPETWVWGNEEQLRAVANGRRHLPGVAKVKLSDGRGRAALFVQEDDLKTG